MTGALAIGFTACGGGEEDNNSSSSSCAADTDCKGDRVCTAGACVDPSGGGGSDMGGGGGGGGGNTDMGGGGGGGGGTDATCAQLCTKLVGCEPSLTQADCEAGCNANIDQATRNCGFNAATCADANACVENGGGGGGGGGGQQDCSISEECETGEYCWQPEGSFQGKCQVNDFGKSCQQMSECTYNFCIYEQDIDDFGKCTRECTVNDECPDGWTCTPPPAGANYNSSICTQ